MIIPLSLEFKYLILRLLKTNVDLKIKYGKIIKKKGKIIIIPTTFRN